jgi:hypothetical protein
VYFATSIAAPLFEIVGVDVCGSKKGFDIPAALSASGASATDFEALT